MLTCHRWGEVSLVRRYLRRIRPAPGRVYQEVCYEPGEAMQVDWVDCNVRSHSSTHQRPIDRFQQEKPRLRMLPNTPFQTDALRRALEYQTYDAAYVETLLHQERRRRQLPSPTPICPRRRELIDEIQLDPADPAAYDRFLQPPHAPQDDTRP